MPEPNFGSNRKKSRGRIVDFFREASNANYGNYGQNNYNKGGNRRSNLGMINRDLRNSGATLP